MISVLGIDIGGTNIRLAQIDSANRILNSAAFKVAQIEGDLVEDLLGMVEGFFANARKPIKAIGLGVPGIINRGGKILSCPNLEILEEIDLKGAMERKFKVPVCIRNDVNFILYGEYRMQTLVDIGVVLGFYIGTGFGFSMIIDGKLITGQRGFAGELGHTPLAGKHDLCNCGHEGCLELYSSGKTIANLTAAAKTELADFFINPVHSSDAQELLNNMLLGMNTVMTLTDPGLVIIGGGVVNMKGFPFETIKTGILERLRHPSVAEDLIIQRSRAGVFGGCQGAAIYCMDQLKAEGLVGLSHRR